MTKPHRVGAKGQVVIPKDLRDRRGLGSGTAVLIEEHEDGVLVRPLSPDRPLRGRFGHSGMAERLLQDRSEEPD
jgi:AbrB family looped-hinge helix DNA binding protein